ncbi:putative Cold-shock DNA-binding protein family [Thiocapsa sp. KS1]|nr:RAMP superfamily CRISPR-associated protein [Thiocapsa sp. KS1]CRI67872.1 putative Cold-shock DNA-binding protein family [Thiocapsa sp. KS1]
MPFHNTYHFVPATGRVPRNGQTSLVDTEDFAAIAGGTSAHPARHDRWVPATHSGRLICRLDLERPTLVGGTQLPPADRNPQGPKRVEPYEATWLDAQGQHHTWTGIPGSSVRGMVSAVAEALSQSSLRILEDRVYSVRVNVREEKALSALGQLVRLSQPAADGSEFELVPVALPTLEQENGRFALPTRWRGVFRDFTWGQVLTSYVDGYEPVAVLGGGKELRLRSDTFLATEQPTSHDPAHPQFYYASLAPAMAFTRSVTEAIDAGLRHGFDPSQPALKVKDARDRHFLLGRRLGHLLTPAQWGQLTPAQQNLHVPGYLRVLGIDGRTDMPTTKKHEIFIPCPKGKPTPRLPVPQHVLKTFEAIGEERARDSDGQHPFALRGIDHWRCQEGDLVYFDIDDNGRISEISISAVWRRKLGDRSTDRMQSAHDFFDAQAPNHLLTPLRADPEDGHPRKGLTPAELLLGVVEERRAEDDVSARGLASRVRVYDAVSFRAPRIAATPITLKTLSSPKPPSPALYFHAETDPTAYIPKGHLDKDSPERHRPNGRKFYLHHPAKGLEGNDPQHWTCRSRAADGRDHLRLSCRPLIPEADNPFWFHLDFDNLSDAELTLLITSLRPGTAHRHKLGLGKSLGLGTVRVEIAGLFLVDRQARYGAKALEQPRYARGWLPGQPTANAQAPAWAARYTREAAAIPSSAGAEDWSTAVDPTSQPWWDPRLIEANALAILNTLGDPTSLQPNTPVHTPLTEQQRQANHADPARTEKETFKWFVANVQPDARKMLPPVEPGQPLPTLPYLPE